MRSKSLSNIVRASAYLAALLLAGGCEHLRWKAMDLEGRYAEGRWSGKLARVVVVDHRGQEYEAAALEIDTGPRMPYGPAGGFDHVAAERVAILLDADSKVIQPDEVPVGQRVEIAGRMQGSSAQVGPVPVRLRGRDPEVHDDLAIWMRGQPRPVE